MNNASAVFLLRFKAETSDLQASIKNISALAKSEAAKAATAPATVGSSPAQKAEYLARDKGKFVGDIRADQASGILTTKEANSMVQKVGQEYSKQFRTIMGEAGVQPGTSAFKEAQKQFNTVTGQVAKETVQAHKANQDAINKGTAATNEETRTTQERTKRKKGEKAPPTPQEAAKQAVGARKTAVEYGREKQAGYLNQIENDPEFAKQAAEEKAMRTKRLAIERQQYNDLLFNDAKTAAPGESIIDKETDARAGTKKLNAIQEASVNQRLLADKEYIGATAASSIAQQKIGAQVAQRLAADTSLQKALVSSAAVERESSAVRKAAVERQLAQSKPYNEAVASQRVSRYNQQTAQAAEFAQLGGVEAAGKAKATEVSLQNRINAVKFEELAVDQQGIKAKARSIVAEQKYKAALDREVALLTGASRGGGKQPPGKRALGFLGGGGGRGGGGYGGGGDESIGDFFGGGLRTTLRYAVPSIALFAVAGQISETIKQASELERIFNQIEAQFQAVDDAASFPNFKQSILDISRETGVASDILANIAFQYKGAFGDQGNDFVIQQTADAAKVAKVTGLDPAEVVDSLTAVTLAFDTTNEKIGNVALDIQDRYGVLAKETIKFLGDIAPVAEDAGFTLEEISTIAGLAQQRSGRTGAVLAESFGRVLPAMKEAKGELLALTAQSDAFKSPEFIKAVMSGDVAKQFQFIAENFTKLNAQGQGFIVNLLGGRREAQAILPVFADSTDLSAEVQKTRDADPDLLENRFKSLQETLGQSTARLSETFKQFGVDLFESGLGDFMKDMVEVARLFVSVFGLVGKVLLTINKATGGMAGRLLAVYTVFKLMSALKGSNFISGIGSALTPAGGGPLRGAGNALFGNAGTPLGRGQGFRGGLEAAGISPLGLGIGAAAVGGTLYMQSRNAQKESDERYAAALRDKTSEEIDKLQEKEEDKGFQIKDGLGAFLTGGKTKTQQLQDEEQRRMADEYAIAQAKILQESSKFSNKDFEEILNTTDARKYEGVQFDSYDEFVKAYTENPEDDNLEEIFRAIGDRVREDKGGGRFASKEDYQKYLDAFNGGTEKSAKQEEVDKALANVENYRSIEELQASYQAGEVNIGKLTDNIDKRIAAVQKALDISPNDETALKEMAKYVKIRNELWGQFIDQQAAIDLQVADFSGQITDDNRADFNIASLKSKLDNPNYNDPTARKETALALVQEYKNKLQQEMTSPTTSQSRITELSTSGIELPESVQQDFIQAQLGEDNIEFTELFNTWRGMAGGKKTEIQNMIRQAASGSEMERKLIIEDLKARAERLKEFILIGAGTTVEIDRAIANYNIFVESISQLESGEDFGASGITDVKADDEMKKQAAKRMAAAKLGASKAELNKNSRAIALLELDQANKDLAAAAPDSEEYYEAYARQQNAENAIADQLSSLADAKSAYAKALAGNDPLAQANIAVGDALRHIQEAYAAGDEAGVYAGQAELANAQNARKQYYVSLMDAQADLDLAFVENDPVAAASAAIASAQRAYANAENDVDRLKAKAAEVRANRQLANVQQDIVNAQLELMMAWADYSGDTVLSSELALQKAKENLSFLKKTGAGDAEIKRAEAAVVQASAQVRDSQLQDKLDTYNFLYEMDKISKGQLIQYLQSLLKIPNLTEQQVRDIQLQIKQLTDDLGDSFNVPSDLALPTLYEIKRLDQLNGSQYQTGAATGIAANTSNVDQRTYNININAQNTLEATAALQVISDAMSSAPRSGVDPRMY